MDLLITGVDLFTAVGASAEITYFSVRAGLNRFTETGAVSRQGAPRVAAVLPGFRHSRDEDRLADLAAESAIRALDHSGIEAARNIGVTLCLAGPPRPDAPTTLDSWTFPFAGVFEARGITARIRAFMEGSASIARAIQDAAVRLDRGDEDATLVGGADSWLSLHALRWLEDRRRLKIDGRVDGLLPGEAAGFLVLESPRRRVSRGPALAVLRAASLAHEPGHYDSTEPCLSVGYTEAVRAALGNMDPGRSPRVLLSDLNGESYKAKEWAAAELRTLPQSPIAHLHPADCFGDVGSMAGVSQLALAAIGLSRGEWSAPAIIVAGSDGSARAVMLADTLDGPGRIEPDLDASLRMTPARPAADTMSSALVEEHLEEAGFLRLQRRLAERRSADRWSDRAGHDRRHAWHLLALAASVPHAEPTLIAAAADGARPREDRAAAVTALALARAPSALRGMWEMVKGKAADPAALVEAFDDLPEAARDALLRRLGEYDDSRVRDLTRQLFAGAVINESELLAAIERSPSIEVRQHAASALVERGSDAVRRMLDSPRLIGTLPPETVAFAAARIARRDALDLTRRLSEAEITPRLLVALGGAGYPDAIEILLHFVSDGRDERADAAGGALATLSGIDLVEPAGDEDAASEIWSRSAERWRAALTHALSGQRSYERIVRGGAWSSERVKESLSEPHARNGVRRTLAAALGTEWADRSVTTYYWLQRRTSA